MIARVLSLSRWVKQHANTLLRLGATVLISGLLISALQGTGSVPVDPANPNPPIQWANIPTPTPIRFVNVVIAVQEIPRGYRIPQNAVAVRPWVEESAPMTVYTRKEDVVGKIARTDIFREQPITNNLVVDDFNNLANSTGRVGSDVAAILPNSLVSTTLFVPVMNLPQGISPGDRVDLIHSIPVTDTASNRPDLSHAIKDDMAYRTHRTVMDALVVYVGAIPPGASIIGMTPTPRPSEGFSLFGTDDRRRGDSAGQLLIGTSNLIPVTLGVTPQDAVLLVWAKEAELPVTLVMRSATDTNRIPTQPITWDKFTQEFGFWGQPPQ